MRGIDRLWLVAFQIGKTTSDSSPTRGVGGAGSELMTARGKNVNERSDEIYYSQGETETETSIHCYNIFR